MIVNTRPPTLLQPHAASLFEDAKQHFLQGNDQFEAGDYAQAKLSFEASLALMPGRISTLGNLGATLIKLGRPAAALLLLDQALALDANELDALSHRGVALADLGRYAEALACHDAVLHLEPSFIPAAYQRCLMLKELGRHQDMLEATSQLLMLDADSPDAWWLHAEALHRLQQHDAALAAFDKLLTFDPTLHRVWSQKAGLLKDLGRNADALAAFEQALAHGGDADLNGYYIASLNGLNPPSAPPRSYVQGLFDDYAEQFDTHLVKVLGYQAHKVLVENLKGIGKHSYRSALDLGCGTGLCAPLVRSQVSRLEGVDLSSRMLDKAHELGLYDHLVQADVAEHLQATDQRYDLLLSCDVFIYVGALEEVFSGAARVLEPGGVFCFSLEPADDAQNYYLTTSQRYAHSDRYLRTLAAMHGFVLVKTLALPIRQDQQQNINGLYLYFVKS